MSEASRRLLDAVRLGLREEILPKLQSEYDRSVVVAMIGILGEVAPRVVDDDGWVEASIRELHEGTERWADALASRPETAVRIRQLAADSARASSAAEARRCLLEAAEIAVRALWADEELRSKQPGALADLRSRLAGDLARQRGSARAAKRGP